MQQTKRRSKKGVILLALAIALLVVAFVPAAAMAVDPAVPSLTPALNFTGLGVAGDQGLTWYGGVNWTVGVNWKVTSNHLAVGQDPIIHSFIYTIDGATAATGRTETLAGNVAMSVVNALNTGTGLADTFGVSGQYSNGVHTVVSHVYQTVPDAGMTYPAATSQFGIDRIAPLWSWSGAANDGIWHSTTATIMASVTDNNNTAGGSGVSPGVASQDPIGPGTKPHITWGADDSATGHNFPQSSLGNSGPKLAAPLYSDAFSYEVTPTAIAPPIPDEGGIYDISGYAWDMLGHMATNASATVQFDLVAPHTTVAVTPPAIDQNNWTNQNVSLAFTATDGLPTPNAGVDYTEYQVVYNAPLSSSPPTAPGIGDSGTHIAAGTPLVISTSATVGPVYVWYRSVDKAVPANKEIWRLQAVYLDKSMPTFANIIPTWWVNHGDGNVLDVQRAGNSLPNGFESFGIYLAASDPNSGLNPPGIEFQMPTWIPATYAIWKPYADFNDGQGFALFVDRASHTTDGIFPLNFRVSDKAGNQTTGTADVKIDTRAPVTQGAAGWVNGLVPYVLSATDQNTGSGVAATIYRVDNSTPWITNAAATVDATQPFQTSITLTGAQGANHTIDFGSVDAALPAGYDATVLPYKGQPSYVFGNLEGTSWVWSGVHQGFEAFTGYKTTSVKLDVTAPVVTAMDPKLGEWQKGPAIVNFSGTDVGSGYAYTEWSTDGGATWTKGEVASVGGNGATTVTYHGVDNVGIKSANQTIVVKVASTRPSVTGGDVSVAKGHRATFAFNVTAVTPTATSVTIEIRSRATGRTFITKRYANVTTNADQSRSFAVNLPKGKYNIRVSATDAAGNVQAKRGGGTLTVH